MQPRIFADRHGWNLRRKIVAGYYYGAEDSRFKVLRQAGPKMLSDSRSPTGFYRVTYRSLAQRFRTFEVTGGIC